MAKRFTDTEKWKKPFIRGLQGAYKLLWIYILDDCDFAGIWQVDFEVAAIRIGESLEQTKALEMFGDRVEVLNGGSKWFIRDFLDFQYGDLNPSNRMHQGVLKLLERNGLAPKKAHASPLQGAKVQVQDKDKDKVQEKDSGFENFWQAYPKKRSKGDAELAWAKAGVKNGLAEKIMAAVQRLKTCEDWLKDGGKFIPYPASWLNAKGWEDEIRASVPEAKTGPREKFKSPLDGRWKWKDTGEYV